MRALQTRSLGVAVAVWFLALAPLRVAAQNSGNANSLSLGVAVSGLVGKIVVADGAHVAAGQTILEMDCRPMQADVKVRAADAAAGEAAYERARNGSRPDEITIGEANVGVAQARAEEAADAYGRLKALTEGVSVTRAQLLEGRREARVTAAQLDDARKRLALLVAGSRQEDIAEALARRDAAAASLEEGRAQLDQCSLKAPVAGVVQVTTNVGQFVSVAIPQTLARLTPDKGAP